MEIFSFHRTSKPAGRIFVSPEAFYGNLLLDSLLPETSGSGCDNGKKRNAVIAASQLVPVF
jgi:hypothetical protein